MPVLIFADVYRCSDPYEYGSPEHWMAKKYFNESQVDDLLKLVKRDLKQCSYWYIRLTRVNMDNDEFVTNEFITHKNKLKKRIQLNAEAKPELPKMRIPKSPTEMPMPTPTASLAQMVAQMEALVASQNTPQPMPTNTVSLQGFTVSSSYDTPTPTTLTLP